MFIAGDYKPMGGQVKLAGNSSSSFSLDTAGFLMEVG